MTGEGVYCAFRIPTYRPLPSCSPLPTLCTTAAPMSDKPTYAAASPRLRQNVADITAAQSQRRGNHIIEAQVDIIRT